MIAFLLAVAAIVALVASFGIESDRLAAVVAWGACALGVSCFLVVL